MKSPLIRKAFEAYASGNFTFARLHDSINALGLTGVKNRTLSISNYQYFLNNPFYYGIMRFAGEYYAGKHEPLITKELFDRCQRIVNSRASDCVLDNPLGHPPGEKYALAVEEYPRLLTLRTNGVAFIARRTVFYAAGSPFELVCSECGSRFAGDKSWSTAVDQWFSGTGPGTLACPKCHFEAPISMWQHDPVWAFGYVGIKFWNWPPLRTDFIAEVANLLSHRVRLVAGKI